MTVAMPSGCKGPWRVARILILAGLLLSFLAIPLLGKGESLSGLRSTPLQAGELMRSLGANEVSWLRDPGGMLRVEDLTDPAVASRFQPMVGGMPVAYTLDAIWLRMTLQRSPDASDHWRLQVTSPLLNDVRLFAPVGGRGYQMFQAGDRFPFADRQQPSRRPVFDLTLADDRPQVSYLRIRTDSTLTAELIIWHPRAYESALQLESLWIGGLFGIVLISIFFFMQAWFLNRDRLLLSAAGVTLAFAFSAAANLGLLSQYFFTTQPLIADALQPVSLAVFIPLLCRLFGQALDLEGLNARFSRLHWVVTVLCVTAVMTRLVSLYAEVGGAMMMAGMLFGLGWITVGGWWVWYERGRGLLTAMAMTLFTASFAIAPVMALGALPASRFWETFWVFGSVGFILLAQFTALDEVRNSRHLRRVAERAAQEAERRADQELGWRRQQALYFAGVAHDLRTPLSAVRIGLANLARSLSEAPLSVQQTTERLQGAARRASDMIERHLQLQRLEQPDFELLLDETAVVDLVSQIRALTVDTWPEQVFRFEILDGVPEAVTIDVEMVIRAITNLLSNAAAASRGDGPVSLTVGCEPGGWLVIAVRDRGPGLRAAAFDELLEVHWRRQRAARGESGPSVARFGIGLPMVRLIAARHRGEVTYRRECDATVITLRIRSMEVAQDDARSNG